MVGTMAKLLRCVYQISDRQLQGMVSKETSSSMGVLWACVWRDLWCNMEWAVQCI